VGRENIESKMKGPESLLECMHRVSRLLYSEYIAIHGPDDTVVFWAGTTGTGVSQITEVGSEGRTGFC
jgi:hypothetical protein